MMEEEKEMNELADLLEKYRCRKDKDLFEVLIEVHLIIFAVAIEGMNPKTIDMKKKIIEIHTRLQKNALKLLETMRELK